MEIDLIIKFLILNGTVGTSSHVENNRLYPAIAAKNNCDSLGFFPSDQSLNNNAQRKGKDTYTISK